MSDIKQRAREMFDEKFVIHESDKTKSGKEIQCDPGFIMYFIDQIIDLAITEERKRIQKSVIDTEKYEQVMANLILKIVGEDKELKIKDIELIEDYCVLSRRDSNDNEYIFKVIKNLTNTNK